ncbi:MAG: hypothetical protein ACTSU5_01510 [Promethearchaeota archaeon]
MKHTKTAGLFLVSLTLAGLIGSLAIVYGQDDDSTKKDLSWTVSNSNGYINEILQNDMLEKCKTPGTAFKGLGIDDSDIFDSSDYSELQIHTLENFVAIAALSARSTLSNNEEAHNFAISDSWGGIKNLGENLGSGSKVYGFVKVEGDFGEGKAKFSYLQGAAMEFLSLAYRNNQYGEIATRVNTLYAEIKTYQSNDSVGYNGDARAFWTAVKGKTDGYGIKVSMAQGSADHDYYNYIQALDNLAVIAGIAHAYKALEGTGNALGSDAIEVAEAAMSAIDARCWDPEVGMYREYAQDSDNFELETQATAMVACARLFAITNKVSYITRAQVLLSSINRYMMVQGLGGAIDTYDKTAPLEAKQQNTAVLRGWTNAMLAYACVELYDLTGKPEFADTAKVVVNFMWNNLFFSSPDKSIQGFVEYTRNTDPNQKIAYSPVPGKELQRYTKTNALILYVNEKIAYFTRSLWEKYMWWFIGAIGGVVIVVVVIVLVSRRSRMGTKLPKVVKGLIGD